MAIRQRYKKKAECFVIAVQLNLDTEGFTYHKWGSEQRCKPGDWLLDNEGEIYSVDSRVFTKTYRKVRPGVYVKTTPVWAEVATISGSVATKEGKSDFKEGDYLVYNNEDGSDAYCVSAAKFESMYELDEKI
jgi:hypothetical protein